MINCLGSGVKFNQLFEISANIGEVLQAFFVEYQGSHKLMEFYKVLVGSENRGKNFFQCSSSINFDHKIQHQFHSF